MTSPTADLPLWAAIIVALLVTVGSAVTLIGSFGLTRLKTFYDRLHSPTIGSSAGVALISAASVVCFSVLQTRLALHEVFIFFFVTISTPVPFMLMARAAIFRERVEGQSPLTPEMEEALRRGPDDAVMEEDGEVVDVPENEGA